MPPERQSLFVSHRQRRWFTLTELTYLSILVGWAFFTMVIAVDLAANPASGTAATWETRVVSSPPAARGAHAMAFDEARGQIVMFGGFAGGSQYLNDTWIWDGNTWQQKAPSIAPSARAGHAMAYDAANRLIVLFGGGDVNRRSLNNDTWVWDGSQWTQKFPSTSPPIRGYHTLAYDALRRQVVLFGGASSSPLNDTWVWDGNNWEQKSVANPPPGRAGHVMVYDVVRSQILLFGGSGYANYNDTWSWDGNKWEQNILTSSPSARFFCAMVYDTSHEEGVLFGGVSDVASFDETWVWDGRKWERKLPALSPPALASHAMAYDAAHRQVVLFGGAVNDRFFNDTWIWNGGASTQTMLSLAAGGAVSTSTLGPAGELIAGYATGTVTSGTAPCGTAVFTYRQDGVVVSEAGVPMSPPTSTAQFFVDNRTNLTTGSGNGTINILTGFAAVNLNAVEANLTLRLRDGNGAAVAQGVIRLAPGAHMAKFLDQLAPDFVLPAGFINNGLGSLEITSAQPVSVLALRLTTNQRGDLLITSTPIADLAKTPTKEALSFPQIADGGGYQTTLILMNTSNGQESGVVRFYGNNGSPLAVRMTGGGAADTHFSYSIPAGGIFRLVTDASPTDVNVGWAQLTPDPGTTSPAGAAIFAFAQRGIIVTESGVAATASTTHARIYLDKSGGHDTGLAVVNPGGSNIRITATAYQSDGVTPIANGPGAIDLAPLGHDAKFAGQFIAGLPDGFVGVLDLSSTAQFAALTLRSLTNARGDFLVTTFPIADVDQALSAPLIFPQLADGAGYQTQIIMLSTSAATSTIRIEFLGNDGSAIAVGQRPSGAAAATSNWHCFRRY